MRGRLKEAIDHQNYVGVFSNLLKQRGELVPPYSAIPRTFHEAFGIQHKKTFGSEKFRDLAVHHTLGEAFNNCRLADAGLADEHRVVSVTLGKDLNDRV